MMIIMSSFIFFPIFGGLTIDFSRNSHPKTTTPFFSHSGEAAILKNDPSTTGQISATFEPNCIQNARIWKAKVRARGSFPYFFIFPIPWLSELSNIVYFDPLIFIHELGGRVLAYLQVCTL